MNKPIANWGNKPTESNVTLELKTAVKIGKCKKLTLEVPEDLHQKFKIYAIKNSTTMSELINTFIHETVNK